MAAPAVTAIDYSGWALFALAFIGQGVTWLVMLRSGIIGGKKSAAADAKQSADQNAALNALAKELGRVANNLETQSAELAKHTLDDVRIQTEHSTILKQLTETQVTMARALENQQRQLMNVALDIAPQPEAERVPANRPRRRAGA